MTSDTKDETYLRTLLDAAPDAIVFTDRSGTVLEANPSAERIFGYEPGSMIGLDVEALMPPGTAAQHGGFINRYLKEREARIIGIGRDLTGRRRDGTEFPLHLSLGHAEAEGTHYFVAIMHDLTRRRQVELALERSQRMEALGELTGGVAHDFNNLLTIITGNIELLAMGQHDEEDAGMLQDALEAAELGTALTAQLLVFARRGILMPQDIDVNAIAQEMSALLRRTLGGRVTLTTVLCDTPWVVQADPAQLQTALVNLAVNARAAMPDGGSLVLETACTTIDDSYIAQEVGVAPGDYMRISVTDTGTGMSEAVKSRAFEPFFTTKPPGQGTGLGLSMLYGFARQSGGHATIYSEEGQGTTVSLYLPRHLPAKAAPAPDSREEPDEEAITEGLGQGQLVLVAEDNAQVRRLSCTRLEALGYRTMEAEDADEAMALLASTPGIAVLFTDIVMPGSMTGYELAQKVTRLYPRVRTLLTTAYAGKLLDANGDLQAGFLLLRKPYRQRELAAKLHRLLAGRTGP